MTDLSVGAPEPVLVLLDDVWNSSRLLARNRPAIQGGATVMDNVFDDDEAG